MLSLLYFTMNSCQPCKTFKPTVISAAAESGVNVNFIDALENSAMASTYSITSVPTLIFLKDGMTVHRMTGVTGKQTLVSQIQQYNS
jgi:thioredoxin 1